MSLLERARSRLREFSSVSLIGIGDVILDEYRRGHAESLSPEAPVPDLLNPGRDARPGGAANVARNASRLGARVSLIGVVGDDPAGASLRTLLASEPGLAFRAVEERGRPTTRKLRFYHDQFQILRVSEESHAPLAPATERALLAALREAVTDGQAVFVEDYGKGSIGPALGPVLEEIRRKRPNLPVILDPKIGNEEVYRPGTFSLLKMNWKEACALAGAAPASAGRGTVVRRLATRYAADVLVTLGPEGVLVLEHAGGRVVHAPARPREAFDVAGAGDTTLAVVSLALAAGAPLVEAAILANAASGLVVEKSGTAYVTSEELHGELTHPHTVVLFSALSAGVDNVA